MIDALCAREQGAHRKASLLSSWPAADLSGGFRGPLLMMSRLKASCAEGSRNGSSS